jgi:hypothetical protein
MYRPFFEKRLSGENRQPFFWGIIIFYSPKSSPLEAQTF